MTLKLVELCGVDPEVNFSPFCWRIRMALAHKGLDYERVPWRYNEAEAIKAYGASKVPVLLDGEKAVNDSWKIAVYLDEKFPDRAPLLGSEGALGIARLVNNWADVTLVLPMLSMIAADVVGHLGPEDAAYFRKTREGFLGRTFEEARDRRDLDVLTFRKTTLLPLRLTLKSQAYVGGSKPNYGDYILFALFQWCRTVSPFKLLAPDDPIYTWRASLMDAFDGLARKAAGFEV
jgi:glutathione S-transferase